MKILNLKRRHVQEWSYGLPTHQINCLHLYCQHSNRTKVNTYMTVYKRSMHKTACMQYSIDLWACTCKYTTPSIVYYVHIFDILWSFLDWSLMVSSGLSWLPPPILGYNNALLKSFVEFSNFFRASLHGFIWLALVTLSSFLLPVSPSSFWRSLISSESFPALSCPLWWG